MQKDFIVYILSNKRKKTITGIIENVLEFESEFMTRYKVLVYFDRFTDRNKAVRKKRIIFKMNNSERVDFIKRKNPEWLNLIFTLTDS